VDNSVYDGGGHVFVCTGLLACKSSPPPPWHSRLLLLIWTHVSSFNSQLFTRHKAVFHPENIVRTKHLTILTRQLTRPVPDALWNAMVGCWVREPGERLTAHEVHAMLTTVAPEA
jgi:hypothetical protein